MSISGAGVEYESDILKAFNESNLIRIIINLKNMSEADNLISTFSEPELKLVRKSSMRIGAEITEKGFNKLINDTRVEAVYLDTIVYATENETAEGSEESIVSKVGGAKEKKIKSDWLILILIVIISIIVLAIIIKKKIIIRIGKFKNII